MFKRIILVGILCIFHCGIIRAEMFVQNKLGDFNAGKYEKTTLSVKPAEEYRLISPSSVKLASQSPLWYRDPFLPPLLPGGSPALADIDNDEDLDMLLVSYKKLHILKNTGTNYQPKWEHYSSWDMEFRHDAWDIDIIDFDGDKDYDIFIGPSVYGENNYDSSPTSIFAYENTGSISKPQWQRNPKWEPPSVIGWANPSLGDIDGDGDMDIILAGNDEGRCYVFENKGISPLGSITWNQRQDWEPATFTTGHGGYASIDLADINNDGLLDLVRSSPDTLGIILNKGSINNPQWKDTFSSIKCFVLPGQGDRITVIWNDHVQMSNPAVADIDNDGDYDIYLQDSFAEKVYLLENIGSKSVPLFKYKISEDTPFQGTGFVGIDLADLDNDGDPDLLAGYGMVTCGWAGVSAYENANLFYGIWKSKSKWNPKPNISNLEDPAIPKFVDIDNDGDLDVYVGGNGFGIPCQSFCYENKGSIHEPLFERRQDYDIPPVKIDISFPTFLDIDRDGDYDVMIGENTFAGTGSLLGFENKGTPQIPNWVRKPEWDILNTTPYPLAAFADLDSDGDPDLCINMQSITFWENKGFPQIPFEKNESWSNGYLSNTSRVPCLPVFIDFDDDGDYDLYLGYNTGNAIFIENKGPHFLIGTFTSTILGSSTAILNWHKIFWSEKKPTNTSIKMQIRTGDSQTPDNSWSEWTSVANGNEIPTDSKYIQYRVILETTELDKSPVLYEVRMTYETKQNKINVYPASSPIGSPVTVEGTGFGANEQIQIDFGKTLSLTFTTTTQAGTFTAIFTVDNQPQGITSVTAGGLNSKLTATDYFIITSYSFIKGYIRKRDNSPMANVAVILSGDKLATYTTQANGYYEFIELLAGTYTVIPTLTNYAFIPSSRTYQPLTSNMDNQDFMGIKGKIVISPISGTIGTQVEIQGNEFLPVEDVRIEFGKIIIGTWTTNSAGTFSAKFSVPGTTEGTITITALGLNSQLQAIDYFYVRFELARFRLDPITTPQTAGIPFTLTITAIDNTGGTLTNFSHVVTLSDLSGSISPVITTKFIAGIWQGTVSITKAGTTSIKATHFDNLGTSNQFYVKAGTPTKFLVYPEKEVHIPAGGSVSITAQLIDAYNNLVGSSGISCNLEVVVISGTGGVLSTTTVTTNENGQIGTITYSVSIHAGDKAKIALIPHIPSLIPTTSGTITTSPASLDHFVFDTIGTQTAGRDFLIKITAKDSYENTTAFDDIVLLFDLTNSLNPKQTTPFTNGIWTGVGSITIADKTDITAIYDNIISISKEFIVKGAELDHFIIRTITTQTAGVGFPITITAKDRFGNVSDGFNGMANLTDVRNTISPTNTTNFISGVWQGTVAITKSGTTTITASNLDKSGTSNSFFVTSGAIDHFLIGTITNQIAGINFGITLTANDKYDNTVTSFSDKVWLKDLLQSIAPSMSGSFSGGRWAGEVGITRAGMTTIFVNYQEKRGTSNPFFVQPGSLHHFRFATITDQTAGNNFNMTIIACDTYENTVTTYIGSNTLTDTTGSIMPKTTSNFINGWLKDFPATIFIAEDGVRITTRGDGKEGLSNPFKVSAGSLDHFRFATITSPQVAGKEFQVVIKAEDNLNNLTNYQGKAFLMEDSQTIFPTSTTNFNSGIWIGDVRITRARTTSITAQSENKYGISNSFKVVAGQLAKIDINPNDVQLQVDESLIFTAKGYDGYGNEIGELGIRSWELGEQIGRLTEIGSRSVRFVAGIKADKAILKAKADSIIATASITILPGILAEIIIDPSEITIEVDGSCTFTAKGEDKYGNRRDEGLGMWDVGYEIGRLVNTSGSKTTFIAKTISQQGTITYEERNVIGSAKITVKHGGIDKFEFDPIPHTLINTPFRIKITARDRYDNRVEDYHTTASLTTTYGNLTMSKANFKNGIFEGTVTIKVNIARPDVHIIVTDRDRNKTSPPFTVLYDDGKKITVKEMEMEMEIGKNSLGKDYYLEITKPSLLEERNIKIANLRLQADPIFKQLNDTIIRIIARDGDKNPLANNFRTNSTTLSISYQDPPSNISEERLKIYVLDEKGIEAKWVEIPNSVVLPGANLIYAQVDRLGTFIVVGANIPAGFENFVVYPNPFKPVRGDEKITFEGLPKNSYIRIYDISGHLIMEVKDKEAIWEWDVRSNEGKKIDSGIYIYLVTTEDGLKRTGKIGVIR